jgi:thymidylate synthase
MSKIDHTFQALCREILQDGREYENKNRGVKRLQIPSVHFRHSFEDGFPALSLKKLYFKSVVAELLFFMKGSDNAFELTESNVHIWDKDSYQYVKSIAVPGHVYEYLFEAGTFVTFERYLEIVKDRKILPVGRTYGVQYRRFNDDVDQIRMLIEGIGKDIFSSRLVVTAWNPSDLWSTALPACHNMFQVIGDYDSKGNEGFWVSFNMRSWDVFLGASFNIASYALLGKILEKVTGKRCLGIICHGNCVHFYDNQYEGAKEILTRDADAHPNCEVAIPHVTRIDGMTDFEYFEHYLSSVVPNDFKLVGYTSDEAIKVDMLAPTKI